MKQRETWVKEGSPDIESVEISSATAAEIREMGWHVGVAGGIVLRRNVDEEWVDCLDGWHAMKCPDGALLAGGEDFLKTVVPEGYELLSEKKARQKERQEYQQTQHVVDAVQYIGGNPGEVREAIMDRALECQVLRMGRPPTRLVIWADFSSFQVYRLCPEDGWLVFWADSDGDVTDLEVYTDEEFQEKFQPVLSAG